jgi:uncharacterized surface protein with fasciclin (FAS1) repeats
MRRRTHLSAFIVVPAVLALLSACATTPVPVSVADTVARDARLTTFNRLMSQAGLAETLRGAGPYTVFAPTDDAFKAVPAKTMDALAANPDQLKAALNFHIVAAALPASAVKNGPVNSVQGATLTLAKAGDFVTVEDAVVQQADMKASNGLIHVVDRVLLPPVKK